MRSLQRHGWLVIVFVLALALPSPVLAQSALAIESAEAIDQTIVQVNTYRESGGRTARGSGSGIVIDPNGLILTAEHVTARATRLEVILRNGQAYTAAVVGRDPLYDAALIQIQPVRPLPFAFLGLSSAVVPGETVVALGRAPRRQAGPTAGALLAFDVDARPGVVALRSSATAWPGDSGGALVNARGEVVGLIVAITRDGSITLSIAIDGIKFILNDLRAGFVRHPWLGITGGTITDTVADELGLPVRRGVLIYEVLEGGPASQAGLRGGRPAGAGTIPSGGDIIIAVDGRTVTSFGQLAAYVLGKRIGDTVQLDLLRDGQPLKATVVLGERPTL